jgi:hypothetical protein
MKLNLKTPVVELQAGEVLALDNVAGTSIKARCGSVWITEEGESKDFVIGPGESRVVKRHGLTLVQALKPSWISIREHLHSPQPAN